jgi:hypothetical protein
MTAKSPTRNDGAHFMFTPLVAALQRSLYIVVGDVLVAGWRS